MQRKTANGKEGIDLEPRDVRALTECMSVLDGFGDAEAGEFVVVSESGKEYDVDVLAGTCDCPDHEHRSNHCKHLRGAEFASGRREIPEWVDADAINNTLGDHIDGSPVFAADADADAEPDAVANATERVVTDGGTVTADAEPQGENGEDAPAHADGCDNPECKGYTADGRPLLSWECWEEWARYDEQQRIEGAE